MGPPDSLESWVAETTYGGARQHPSRSGRGGVRRWFRDGAERDRPCGFLRLGRLETDAVLKTPTQRAVQAW